MLQERLEGELLISVRLKESLSDVQLCSKMWAGDVFLIGVEYQGVSLNEPPPRAS